MTILYRCLFNRYSRNDLQTLKKYIVLSNGRDYKKQLTLVCFNIHLITWCTTCIEENRQLQKRAYSVADDVGNPPTVAPPPSPLTPPIPFPQNTSNQFTWKVIFLAESFTKTSTFRERG